MAKETMKAVVFKGPGKVVIEDRPVPKIKDATDIIVKVDKVLPCDSFDVDPADIITDGFVWEVQQPNLHHVLTPLIFAVNYTFTAATSLQGLTLLWAMNLLVTSTKWVRR